MVGIGRFELPHGSATLTPLRCALPRPVACFYCALRFAPRWSRLGCSRPAVLRYIRRSNT